MLKGKSHENSEKQNIGINNLFDDLFTGRTNLREFIGKLIPYTYVNSQYHCLYSESRRHLSFFLLKCHTYWLLLSGY